jgi:hypothetical protein
MSTEGPTTDYEDLTEMRLDEDQIAELVGGGGECVFSWTTRDGFPVGVVVAYVYHEGKFWTTCAERRKRVPALQARPQSAVVINKNGRTASYKGNSVVHTHDDPDWQTVKTWFYGTLSGAVSDRNNLGARNFEKFLDSPHRVIVETEANLVVGFDTAKFGAFTAAAIAAGLGVDEEDIPATSV